MNEAAPPTLDEGELADDEGLTIAKVQELNIVPTSTESDAKSPTPTATRPTHRGTTRVRIATFNCENLVARYKFPDRHDIAKEDGFTLNDLAFSVAGHDKREITAAAFRKLNADIVALQEVENCKTLDRFNQKYLKGMGYEYTLVIDAHDPRMIDCGVLSRHPLLCIRSHKDERDPTDPKRYLFSRDCLELDFDVNGAHLTLYVNHFKALSKGRAETAWRRHNQATRVVELINQRWKPRRYRGNFAVLGDLNDYNDGETSLTPLLQHPELVNVVERLPVEEQWTHYWGAGDQYQQLDYILLSRYLAKANPNPPQIIRDGMPLRASRYKGTRFPNVGHSHPKASDHAPVAIDLVLRLSKHSVCDRQFLSSTPAPLSNTSMSPYSPDPRTFQRHLRRNQPNRQSRGGKSVPASPADYEDDVDAFVFSRVSQHKGSRRQRRRKHTL